MPPGRYEIYTKDHKSGKIKGGRENAGDDRIKNWDHMKRHFKYLLLLIVLLSLMLLSACSSAESGSATAIRKQDDIVTPEDFTFTDEMQHLSHQALKLPSDDIDLQYTGASC